MRLVIYILFFVPILFSQENKAISEDINLYCDGVYKLLKLYKPDDNPEEIRNEEGFANVFIPQSSIRKTPYDDIPYYKLRIANSAKFKYKGNSDFWFGDKCEVSSSKIKCREQLRFNYEGNTVNRINRIEIDRISGKIFFVNTERNNSLGFEVFEEFDGMCAKKEVF